MPVAVRDALPVDVRHEGIDVGAGLGAEVEVVGVLVHVKRQRHPDIGQRVGVVDHPAWEVGSTVRTDGTDHR